MNDKNQNELKKHIAAAGHASDEHKPQPHSSGSTAEDATGGPADMARNIAGQASEAIQGTVERGRDYARKAMDRYPEVNRQVRDTSEPLIRAIKEQPVLCVAIAAGAGLLLGMLLTGTSSRRS